MNSVTLGSQSMRSALVAVLATIAIVLTSAFAIASAQSSGSLKVDSLDTEGLNYENELTALYLGDFNNVGWNRERGTFVTLFPMYVTSYGRRCPGYLPDNRVEIMTQECARESTPVNVYGNPVGPTTCVQYRTVGTGIFAKPDLYQIKVRLNALTEGAVIGDMFFDRSNDPFATTAKWTDALVMANDDSQQLFNTNRCDSPALMRLEANMARFANGE